MLLDAIISLGGLIVPPLFDFIKKKFIKQERDTPEATMSTLATTKPESLAPYVAAMSRYLESQVSWFNRDVVGNLHPWIVNLRGGIRPIVIVIGLIHMASHGYFGDAVALDAGTRYFYEVNISSWFGARLTK